MIDNPSVKVTIILEELLLEARNMVFSFDSLLRLENLGLIKQDMGMFKAGFATGMNSVPIAASYSNKLFSFPVLLTTILFSRSKS